MARDPENNDNTPHENSHHDDNEMMFERHLIEMYTFNYLGLRIDSDLFPMKSFREQKENKHRICDDNHSAV